MCRYKLCRPCLLVGSSSKALKNWPECRVMGILKRRMIGRWRRRIGCPRNSRAMECMFNRILLVSKFALTTRQGEPKRLRTSRREHRLHRYSAIDFLPSATQWYAGEISQCSLCRYCLRWLGWFNKQGLVNRHDRRIISTVHLDDFCILGSRQRCRHEHFDEGRKRRQTPTCTSGKVERTPAQDAFGSFPHGGEHQWLRSSRGPYTSDGTGRSDSDQPAWSACDLQGLRVGFPARLSGKWLTQHSHYPSYLLNIPILRGMAHMLATASVLNVVLKLSQRP